MSIRSLSRPRPLALLAGGALVLGAGFASIGGPGLTGDDARRDVDLAGAVEDVSGPCDEAEHATDPRCIGAGSQEQGGDDDTSTTSTTVGATAGSPSTTPGAAVPDEVRTIDAAGAGTVVVAVEAGQLRLVAVHPAEGWVVEVEQAAGREVEVDLDRGSVEVDVDVEIEDGRVRERVRVRDDAAGTEVRTEDGVVTRVEDDRSGSGHGGEDRSGPSHDDDDDDRSGSGRDDDDDDDRSGSDDDDGTPDQGPGDR